MKKILYSVIALVFAGAVLTACEDVPAPYNIPTHAGSDTTNVAGEGDGSLANPYNVSALISLCSSLQKSSTSGSFPSDTIYAKGIVSKVESGDFNASYGNLTYYISDNGAEENEVEVYRGYGLGKNKFKTAEDLKVGDTVIVVGQVVNWLGKVNEFTNGNYLVYHNGKTAGVNPGISGTPAGDGSQADPFNVVAALQLCAGLQQSSKTGSYLSDEVYTKGIISTVKATDFSANNGNYTYYISDDGSTTNELEVFRGVGLGGDKFTSADDLKAGDTVIVVGKLVNWQGTYEYNQGNKLVYLNGKTGGSTPATPSGDAGTVVVNGTTVTITNGNVQAAANPVVIDMNEQGLSNQTDASEFTFDGGLKITFDKGSNSNGPKFYTATKGVRVYSNNTIKFETTKKIAKIVFTCDKSATIDYVGNEEQKAEFYATGALYTNAWTGAGGGTQIRVQTISVYYAE